MAAIQPSVKCTCQHRQFMPHSLSVITKYMLTPSECWPYLYLSYNTKCCSQPAAILYQLLLQLLWLTSTLLLQYLYIFLCQVTYIHMYCMLLFTDVTLRCSDVQMFIQSGISYIRQWTRQFLKYTLYNTICSIITSIAFYK